MQKMLSFIQKNKQNKKGQAFYLSLPSSVFSPFHSTSFKFFLNNSVFIIYIKFANKRVLDSVAIHSVIFGEVIIVAEFLGEGRFAQLAIK